MQGASDAAEQDQVIKSMVAALSRGPKEVLPSRYWEFLNEKNLSELAASGYDNFKRTVALNYYTAMPPPLDAQIRQLVKAVPPVATIGATVRTLATRRHELFTWPQTLSYTFLTLMLWEHARRVDSEGLLERVIEPAEGNPPEVRSHGRLISQDLANSFLEYRTIMHPYGRDAGVRTVFELGAGYGRDAYVFLKAEPSIRYVIADIPPALYLSQKYLSSQFPDRRIFKFRDFKSYDEVRSEFEAAQIAFLVPNQLRLLPDRSADLFINISSLHEMRMDQIDYFFGEIDRLTKKLFYTKQWVVSEIPKEDIVIKEADYPVRSRWRELFHRPCPLRTYFFEVLYQMNG